MNLLLSAYACAPGIGSDWAVGWNWVTGAHRLGHRVWAMASPTRRRSIEAACHEDPSLSGIAWIFPEVASWPLQEGREPSWERTYNLLWQRSALRHARQLSRDVRFDAVHHVTWGGIRAPTFLGQLKRPLIIGPVGGGEACPSLLRDGFDLRGKALEWMRDVSNATITVNPVVRPGLRSADIIFATTTETRKVLGSGLGLKTVVFAALAIPHAPALPTRRPRDAPPRLLLAGRLLYWKGLRLALRAFAEVARRISGARLTIVGDGPERSRVNQDVDAMNLRDVVDMIPRVPQARLFSLYEEHDLLLFPSLHESGGFVVLEALARGLPVVCLDLGGPRDMVTPGCGLVVPTDGRTTSEVAELMGRQVADLIASPSRLLELSAGAVARAGEFVLSDRIAQFYEIAGAAIGLDQTPTSATLRGAAR